MKPFFHGLKIGVIIGIILTLLIYFSLFKISSIAILQNTISVLIHPIVLPTYKIIILMAVGLSIPIILSTNKKIEMKLKMFDKKDIGILSGVSWSFTAFQISAFVLNFPSILNDIIRDGRIILF